MAEFVEKRCEEMLPELEQMEKIKLLEKHEIREVAKKRKDYEYKIQRHVKCKEDYLRYIQYEMNLLKLIKQRRDKYGITQKKSAIDFSITNKVNQLYKQAIFKFQDDIRFWIAHIKFCKHANFKNSVGGIISRMLQVHQDKPKCWHIAAMWEKEENKNTSNARQYLLKGLHFHPESQLLLVDIFKLELEIVLKGEEKQTNDMEAESSVEEKDIIPTKLKTAYVIYNHAFKKVKDIKFIIELLNIAKEHKDAFKLYENMLKDLMTYFAHEPLAWDTMARRELDIDLPQPYSIQSPTNIDTSKKKSLRERIASCNEVYQTAVKKIKTEEMWSLYIECLLEINLNTDSLPNYKRKLLKNALIQGHQSKKLVEKYYLHWIKMIDDDQKNEESQKKLCELYSWATEAVPQSEILWKARFNYLLFTGHKDADEIFETATKILGARSLSLWKLKYLNVLSTNNENIEKFFQTAFNADPAIANEMKPVYIEWLVLKKGIQDTRNAYEELCLRPPFCLKLHQKMAELELRLSMTKHARRPYEMAALQFGKSNINVWIDYILFETNHGKIDKVALLYNRAIKTLDAPLTDKFIYEYSLLKTNPKAM